MTRLSLAILLLLALSSSVSARSNLRRRLEEATEAPTDGATEWATEADTATDAPTEDDRSAATDAPFKTYMPSEDATETESPSTESPSTESPSTDFPSSESPSSESPSSESPSSESPSSESPSTEAPTEDMTEMPDDKTFTDMPSDEEKTGAPTEADVSPAPTAAPVKGKGLNDQLVGSDRGADILMTDGDDQFDINSIVTVIYFEGQGGQMDEDKLLVFNERLEQLEAALLSDENQFGNGFAKFKIKDLDQVWDEATNTLTLFFTSHVELEAGRGNGQSPHTIARIMSTGDYKEHIHTLMAYGQGGINQFTFTCTGTGARLR